MTGQPHAHWLELWVSSGFNAPNSPKIHLSLVASADKPSSLAKFLLLLLPKIGCFTPYFKKVLVAPELEEIKRNQNP